MPQDSYNDLDSNVIVTENYSSDEFMGRPGQKILNFAETPDCQNRRN